MQPIFHGGSLMAKRRSAIQAYEQALAAYEETVLNGIQDVADTLKALEFDALTLATRALASQEALTTFNITAKQYRIGTVSQVALLEAQRQLYHTQIQEVQAVENRYADTAALFQSLGGGWWNP